MVLLHKPALLALIFLVPLQILLLANIGAAAMAAPESASSIDLKGDPLDDAAPVAVQVGLYIMELPMVNEPAEDFELQGYLYATWRDDRLAIHGNHQPAEPRTLDPQEVWNPQLDMTNAPSFRSFRRAFFSFPDGTVFWEERFDAVFSNQYYLRRFPFDGSRYPS
jgi:hypothetical protein